MTIRLALMLSLVAAHLSLCRCAADPTVGYSTTTTFPQKYQTVAVQIFVNETFERGIEYELTDAIIKQIESRTPYKVVPQARADTILTGSIRGIERDQLSKSRLTGLAEEMIYKLSIDFQWRNLRTNEAIIDRRAFAGHGLFVPSNPTGEPIALGQYAAVQQLAQDVVTEMRAEW